MKLWIESNHRNSLLFFLQILLYAGNVGALWPLPKELSHGTSTVWLSPAVELSVVDRRTAAGPFAAFWGLKPFGWLSKSAQAVLGSSKITRAQFNADSHGSHNDTEEQDINILKAALERTKDALFWERFTPRKFYPRNALVEPIIADITQNVHIKVIRIVLTNEPIGFTGLSKTSIVAEEAYSLFVPLKSAGKTSHGDHVDSDSATIDIRANTVLGGMHALQTLSQLFYTHSSIYNGSTSSSTSTLYIPNAPVHIVDAPAFPHRGLNLDIARNVIPPSSVMRVIDGMSLNKLNRLHIHAADAQSWPLEIPRMPELATHGAYDCGYFEDGGEYDAPQIWTTTDLCEIQQYGRARGVEVYLEIDIPGHTSVVAQSHPELVTAAYAMPWYAYAAEPPAGQLLLNSSAVREFLTKLLDEDLLIRATAPFTSLFHFGGDEVNRNAYTLDSGVQSSDKKTLRPLLQELIDHVASMAAKHGVTPVFWEEMVLDWDLKLPRDAIIQAWRGAHEPRDDGAEVGNVQGSSNDADAREPTNSLLAVLQRGHRALFGANSHWYLDCGHGGFLDPADEDSNLEPNGNLNQRHNDIQSSNDNAHDPPNLPITPQPTVRPPYTDYCSPYKNWRQVYTYDPLAAEPEPQLEPPSNAQVQNPPSPSHRHPQSTHTFDPAQILGGEVHLWTEQTDDLTLDAALWPRVAAAAEVLWRGGAGTASNKDNKAGSKGAENHSTTAPRPSLKLDLSESVTRRLAEMRERLVRKGIRAGVVTMEWCLRHKGACVV